MTLGEFATACESIIPAGWKLSTARESDTGTFQAVLALIATGATVTLSVPANNPGAIGPTIQTAVNRHDLDSVQVGQTLRLKATGATAPVVQKNANSLVVRLLIPVEAMNAWELVP